MKPKGPALLANVSAGTGVAFLPLVSVRKFDSGEFA